VSQLLLEEADTQSQSIKSSRRDSVSLLMAISDYPLLEVVHQPLRDQDKDKEKRFRPAPPVPSRTRLMNEALIDSFELAADIFPKRFHDDSKISRSEDIVVKRVRQDPYPGDAVYMQSHDRVMLEK
jgi:hypothetical protein